MCVKEIGFGRYWDYLGGGRCLDSKRSISAAVLWFAALLTGVPDLLAWVVDIVLYFFVNRVRRSVAG